MPPAAVTSVLMKSPSRTRELLELLSRPAGVGKRELAAAGRLPPSVVAYYDRREGGPELNGVGVSN